MNDTALVELYKIDNWMGLEICNFFSSILLSRFETVFPATIYESVGIAHPNCVIVSYLIHFLKNLKLKAEILKWMCRRWHRSAGERRCNRWLTRMN